MVSLGLVGAVYSVGSSVVSAMGSLASRTAPSVSRAASAVAQSVSHPQANTPAAANDNRPPSSVSSDDGDRLPRRSVPSAEPPAYATLGGAFFFGLMRATGVVGSAVRIALSPSDLAGPEADELSPEKLRRVEDALEADRRLREAASYRPPVVEVLSSSSSGFEYRPLGGGPLVPPVRMPIGDLGVFDLVPEYDAGIRSSPYQEPVAGEDWARSMNERKRAESSEYRSARRGAVVLHPDDRVDPLPSGVPARLPREVETPTSRPERPGDVRKAPAWSPLADPPLVSDRGPADRPYKVPDLTIEFRPDGVVRVRRGLRARWARRRRDSKYDYYYLEALQLVTETLGELTEIDDFAEAVGWAIYDSNGVQVLNYAGYLEAGMMVARGEAELDIGEAIVNIAINQVQDQVIGRLTRAAQDRLNKAGWSLPRGFAVGPAL